VEQELNAIALEESKDISIIFGKNSVEQVIRALVSPSQVHVPIHDVELPSQNIMETELTSNRSLRNSRWSHNTSNTNKNKVRRRPLTFLELRIVCLWMHGKLT
jgi:uncharacterized protein (DUF39 family)